MDPVSPVRKESEKTALSQVGKDNKSKGWFLTYPQCPADAQSCLDDLRDKLQEKWNLAIEEYVVCEEKHQDGSPHLHAFLKLDRKIRFKGDRFNFIYEGKEYHGDYQIAKSWHAVQRYVAKDKKYITNLNLKAAMQKQSKKIGIKELETDPLELLEKGVITGLQLASFVKNQNIYKMLKNKRKANREIQLDIEKKRHIWYYGESNTGKTYRIKQMIKDDPDNWFQIPLNNDWIGYNEEKNLYIDEFKGQLTIQELNRLCDGGAKVNVKGGTVQLASDVVIYICSNYNIKECYKKADPIVLESLYNRFNEKMCYKTNEKYEVMD